MISMLSSFRPSSPFAPLTLRMSLAILMAFCNVNFLAIQTTYGQEPPVIHNFQVQWALENEAEDFWSFTFTGTVTNHEGLSIPRVKISGIPFDGEAVIRADGSFIYRQFENSEYGFARTVQAVVTAEGVEVSDRVYTST